MTPSEYATAHNLPPYFAHQLETDEKAKLTQEMYDASDPGTGKTRTHLEIFRKRREAGAGPLLVLAPKSILEPAWVADVRKFFPTLTTSVAYAHNREKAFKVKADIYVTNWDALTWLVKHEKWLAPIFKDGSLIGDEATAIKNPSAQRSKAARRVAGWFKYRTLACGTPNPNTITELWNQVYVLDGGERLGKSYWQFRSAVCMPEQNGPNPQHIRWVDKEDSEQAVFDLISDISIRHKLEECIDMPERVVTYYDIDLPKSIRSVYDELRKHRVLELSSGVVVTPQASAVAKKLMQICSGGFYANEQLVEVIDDGRAELVMDLIEARRQCLVAFEWKHQRDALIAAAKQRGLTFGVIDGETTNDERNKVVDVFQKRNLRIIFVQPQSASHGLTLTAGTTTIWTSPTASSERYTQLNHRIYRAGQTERTETIMIRARNTIEVRAYELLEQRLGKMELLRELLEEAA